MAERRHIDRSQPIRLRAAALVQEAILGRHLRPGQEIQQLWLSRRLGLSQASVREALQELEHRGLITRMGRTCVVTCLSEDDLVQLYQVRAALEPLACRQAAPLWRQELSEQLEDCIARMERAARKRDYPDHSQADLDFHRVIWANQRNRILEHHLSMLCLPLFAYDLLERAAAAYLNFDRSLRQHRAIVNVLRTRDGVRAERLMRRLIGRFQRQDVADFQVLRSRGAGFA